MPIQRITSGILADGAIVAADIADGIVTNAKLAGSITSDKITSVSNTAIAGLIQAAQIGSANASVINAGTLAGARLPAGSVLQVVQAVKTDTYSVSLARGTTDSTDAISASITPTSASSKILILASLQLGLSNFGNRLGAILHRGGSVLSGYTGDAAGNRARLSMAGTTHQTWAHASISANFLDSPNTTGATTYSFRLRHGIGETATIYLNRSHDDEDQDYQFRLPSTITLVEIAA